MICSRMSSSPCGVMHHPGLRGGLEGEITHRAAQPPLTCYEKHLEVETSLAQQGYCYLWFVVFGKGFAYYGFLEKDLGREGSQTAQRSILLWLRPKPHPIFNGFQTSVQLEPT